MQITAVNYQGGFYSVGNHAWGLLVGGPSEKRFSRAFCKTVSLKELMLDAFFCFFDLGLVSRLLRSLFQ